MHPAKGHKMKDKSGAANAARTFTYQQLIESCNIARAQGYQAGRLEERHNIKGRAINNAGQDIKLIILRNTTKIEGLSTEEICKKTGVAYDTRYGRNAKFICRILKELGFTRRKKSLNSHVYWAWYAPQALSNNITEAAP